MQSYTIFIVLIALTFFGFRMGRNRAVKASEGHLSKLHSLPIYHGLYVAIWCSIPSLLIIFIWIISEPLIVTTLVLSELPVELQNQSQAQLNLLMNDVRNIAAGNIGISEADPAVIIAAERYSAVSRTSGTAQFILILNLAIVGLTLGIKYIAPHFRARILVERVGMILLIIASTIAILTTIGIVLSLIFESIRFFEKVTPIEFFFGLEWSPQIALREDQVASDGSFGAVPIFAGTALISFIAMIVAVPIGLMSAVYLAEYAHSKFRAIAKPLLEILAGIPTVVYGFFAALTVAPFLRDSGGLLGLSISSESALAAGGVMGIMIIPFISSLSDDVITAVPQAMRDGSYGLGATKSETILRVILPAALPGIVGSVLLAVSRAIGETMIVVMAAGLSANLTANPFEAVTTVTVQIVTLLVGDQEFDSAKTLAAFALGLTLFAITLCLNFIALRVVQKYREKYE